MVALRRDALPQHDLDPGVLREQFVGHAEHAPGLAEELDAVAQAGRDLHAAAAPPEGRVGAVRDLVVQHDEVADVLDLVARLAVVLGHVGGADALGREGLQQPHDAALDEVDAGGLQRLDEAAGQADGHAVAAPGLVPLAGRELDEPRLRQRGALHLAQQLLARLLVGQVAAAVDQPVAHAVLQRNAPLPAGLVRDGPRVGHRLAHRSGLHRHGAVAVQPVRPVLVGHLQRLADQQAAEARAVDEQVALQCGAGIQPDGLDAAALGVGLHADDPALDALHAEALAEAPQELRIQARVQVEGVVHAAPRQVRETVRLRGLQLQAVVAVVAGQLALAALQPEVLEARGPVVLAREPEGVDVVLPHVAPVLEADAELEGGLRGGHELLFVDVEQLVEGQQRGDRGLAHAHGADLVGLDQADVQRLAQRLAQAGRHHPAGRAAAGDDDAPHALAVGGVGVRGKGRHGSLSG